MSKYTHLHCWHDWQDLELSIKILPHQNISEKRSALNSDITHETVHQFLGGLAIKSTSSVTINLCFKSLAHQRLIEYLLNLPRTTRKASHSATLSLLPNWKKRTLTVPLTSGFRQPEYPGPDASTTAEKAHLKHGWLRECNHSFVIKNKAKLLSLIIMHVTMPLFILNIHWNDWCWSSSTLSTGCEEPTHWKRPWCWERQMGGEGGNREWGGWVASLTQWTWVWANPGREWRTGKSGGLQSMGSQRAGLDWAPQQQCQLCHTSSWLVSSTVKKWCTTAKRFLMLPSTNSLHFFNPPQTLTVPPILIYAREFTAMNFMTISI